MYVVYVCRVRRPTQTDHGVCTLRGTDRACICFFCHRCVGRCCTNRLHGCIVCECMESLCVYIVVHAHRANAFVRVPGHGTMGMDGWMDGVRAFMSSVVDARGDGRIRETHRARPSTSFASNASLPRLSRSLSLSNDEFIHSLIHSFIPLRTNERTKGRTNERTTGRAREGRERDGLDRRVRSHPIARAREEVRASVSNARRIERIESRVHFKPPIHRRRSRRMRRGMNATE